MSEVAVPPAVDTALRLAPVRESNAALMKLLLAMALPVLAEHTLHIGVGMTDTYLANHLVATAGLTGTALDQARVANADSGAAVGSVTQMLWFVGLLVTAIGSGATAIIARAIGSKHKRLANKVCGQSMLAALAFGSALAVALRLAAPMFAAWTGLEAAPAALFIGYIRTLAFGVPFALVMFTANSCLRGAGDTRTPAIAMIIVDLVNVAISVTLAYGYLGTPRLGFQGIAIGSTTAYITGGLVQFGVLVSGRGKLRLFLHRLRPDWLTMKRVFRIGLPAGAEGLLMWLAQSGVLFAVNKMGPAAGAAHNTTTRIESISYMSGFAVGIACASLVGQSLGMRSPQRAWRVAYLSFGLAGTIMTCFGLLFVTFSSAWAGVFTDDPQVARLTAACLFITGFIQTGFAAAIVFGSALRGAGDTLAVMVTNLASITIVRFGGVMIATHVFRLGLDVVWMILAGELFLRGALLFVRFRTGRWVMAKV